MATQFLEFALQPGKDGPYHLGLCRKILRHVSQEQPSQRRFALWLRQNQIYDRALLQFLVKLLDVKVGAKVTLGEAGLELAAEAAKGGAVMPAVPDPGAKEKKAPAKDPFAELLFDRFVELNGYLPRFVFCEIADGFLALTEVTLRIGSAIYHGERPKSGELNAWFKWMEWLGYLKNVGFRHKLTERGLDAWHYLKEIPEEELLDKGALAALAGLAEEPEGEVDTRKFITAEELGAGPNTEPPALPARDDGASEAGGGDGDDEEEEEADFGPSGAAPPLADEPVRDERPDADGWIAIPESRALPKAPPPARAAAAPAAKKAPAAEEEPELSEEEEEAIRELFGEVHAPPPKPKPAAKPPEPEAAPAPAAAPAAAAAKPPAAPPSAPAPAPAPAPEQLDEAAYAAKLEALAADAGELVLEAPAAPGAGPALDPAAIAAKAAALEARSEQAAKAAGREQKERERFVPAPVHPEPPATSAHIPLAGDAVEVLAAQWEAAPSRRPLGAREALGHAGEYADGRQAFALFSLATAALVLEAEAPFSAKRALLRELERTRALELIFELDGTLDQALDALGLLEPGREIGAPEERLVHLPRLKRALGQKGAFDALARAPETRAAALRELTGFALGAGAYWVDREMRRLGLW